MNKQSKVWETPQLIILARGTPEESVLEGCKTMNPNQPFPVTRAFGFKQVARIMHQAQDGPCGSP